MKNKILIKKRNKRVRNSVFSILNYVLFFFIIAFCVTSCILLFMQDMPVVEKTIRYNAGATLINVLFISLIYTIAYQISRGIRVGLPVNRILDATDKIGKGDFSVRIKPRKVRKKNEFDVIVDDLNKMAEELASVETMRVDFAANVSHELKTPLSVIQNYSTLLSQPGISEDKRIEYANSISHASRNLSELVSNILRLNKLENQQIFPEYENYDLCEQLCESLISFENALDEKQLDLRTYFPDNVFVCADRELMFIVWTNLISNAIKYTPEHGTVSVSVEPSRKHICISISDTGCGIDSEILPRIFEKFYQADLSHSSCGNGLGLAITKRIIEVTNNKIEVSSIPQRGSTFTVTMPVRPKDQ